MMSKEGRRTVRPVSAWLLLFLGIMLGSQALTLGQRADILLYLHTYYNIYNPYYHNYVNDPHKQEDTNFASQALLAGRVHLSQTPFTDAYGCIYDRDILELELETVLRLSRTIITDMSHVPSDVNVGDVVFFPIEENYPSELVGVIIGTDFNHNDEDLGLAVAYHSDSPGGVVGDIKSFQEMLLVYGRARLYQFP